MHSTFDAIPAELRAYKQWILWRYEDVGAKKPTKVPYTRNGTKASVTNPDDWCSFDDAVSCYNNSGYSGIGFVFSKFDPFAFIDLDHTEGNQIDLDRQIKIFKEFDSYSEISPSGKGLHIIVKGSIPQGRRRSHIEIYSDERYATMTGQIYNNKSIADKHDLLNQLFNQMGGSPTIMKHDGNAAQTQKDIEVIAIAENASNGDKFKSLMNGEWEGQYPSQSEADFALIDIIAFYTQNKAQIERIFISSGLGRRRKDLKNKSYLPGMIERSFDRLLPPIDFDGFKIALEEKLAAQQLSLPLEAVSSNGKTTAFDAANLGSTPNAASNGPVAQWLEPVAHNGLGVGSNPTGTTNPTISHVVGQSVALKADANAAGGTISPPPGLMGEIAQFIYQAAPRPVPEIAIAGAMGLMAGICGRAYNVSGTGLNQYILCLAMTGAGKEAIASGIDKIIDAVSLSVPVASEFVGPSEIASGQALIKYLSAKSQSFVSVLGEFGIRLKAISSPKASSAEVTLRRMLLDLYNKSGHGQSARPSIYSDIDKNTNVIVSPAFSIVGESTPERFYEALDDSMIYEGLLPRFTLIEYHGNRPAFNPQAQYVQPNIGLVQKIADIMANAKTIMANRKVINISYTPDAEKRLYDFDKLADEKINTADKEIIRQLWNRAHIKAMKIAGLIAVGCDALNPIINIDNVEWAISLVENDIRNLSKKFETGQIGLTPTETLQINDLKRILAQYIVNHFGKYQKYDFISKSMHAGKIIPYKYMIQRVSTLKSYKDARFRPTDILAKTLKVLADMDYVQEVNKKQMIDVYGSQQRAFVITNVSIIDEVEL